jgi:ATP/maltotriose-dependent transcriptional regulator MalT
MGLGEAKSRVGDLGEGVRTWEEAISLLEKGSAQHDVARLHKLMAWTLSDRGDFREADRHVAAGLAALGPDEPSDEHVELLMIALYTASRRAELADVQPAADRVIEMAERVDTPKSQVLAGVAEVSALLERADYDRALRVLQRLGPMAVDYDDKEFVLRQHTIPALIALVRGDLAAAREAIRRSTVLARHIGIPRREYRLYMYSFIEGFYSGDWDRAQETLQELDLLIETTDSPRLRFIGSPLRALLSAVRADFETADRCLRAMKESGDLGRLPADPAQKLTAIFDALVALERGDPAAALGHIARCDGHYLPGLLPPWGWVARGEAEAKSGLLSEANKTATDLSRLGPVGSYPDAAAARIRGIAAASAGEPGDAIEQLAYASETLARLGMPFEAARCDVELAEVAVRADAIDGTLADRLARSYETSTRLGADRYAARARRLLHSLGRPVPVHAVGGLLTPRQLEVGELVAMGMSNAEIAEELFISVRTVTSHLDHIYTKLGIGSRAALAAYVAENRSKTLT